MTLLNRGGVERTPNALDGRGYTFRRKCSRCGGAGGSAAWAHTGTVCYDCRGSGLGGMDTEKLYTAEELAVLNERLAKKQAKALDKRQAAQAIVDAERAAIRQSFLIENETILGRLAVLVADERASRPEWKDEQGITDFWADVQDGILTRVSLSDAQSAMIEKRFDERAKRIAHAAAQLQAGWLGKVGERIKKVKAKVVFSKHVGTNTSFYPPVHRYLVKLETEAGHAVTWWTTHPETVADEYVEVAFTVKEHDSYQGVPQTIVQRVAFKQAPVAAIGA